MKISSRTFKLGLVETHTRKLNVFKQILNSYLLIYNDTFRADTNSKYIKYTKSGQDSMAWDGVELEPSQ